MNASLMKTKCMEQENTDEVTTLVLQVQEYEETEGIGKKREQNNTIASLQK